MCKHFLILHFKITNSVKTCAIVYNECCFTYVDNQRYCKMIILLKINLKTSKNYIPIGSENANSFMLTNQIHLSRVEIEYYPLGERE